jgi:hypothetical protein
MLETFQRPPQAKWRLVELTADIVGALEFLAQLAWPANRQVLFPIDNAHCGLINNSRNGSDSWDDAAFLARHLSTRVARVVAAPSRIWTNQSDVEVLQYEACIFTLYDSNGETIRTVECIDDGGKWTFGMSGMAHSIEASFPYSAKRKRDRFTRAQLRQLVTAFGLPLVTTESLIKAGNFYLFEATGLTVEICSIEEADDPAYGYYLRGKGWVRHMATHAESVIVDFERCVRLNPEYASKVRAQLDEAYRTLGRTR